MSVETKGQGPWWTLIFVAVFGLFAVSALTQGALFLTVGFGALAVSAWQRRQGKPARRFWLVGVVLVLGTYAAAFLFALLGQNPPVR